MENGNYNVNFEHYFKIRYQYLFINHYKYTTLKQDINKEKYIYVVVGRKYIEILYFPLNFSINLKLLFKSLFMFRSSYHGAAETNLTSNPKLASSIPGLAQRVKDLTLL